MATIVAIDYPDQGTAEQAQVTVFRLDDELIIRAEQVAVISRDVVAAPQAERGRG